MGLAGRQAGKAQVVRVLLVDDEREFARMVRRTLGAARRANPMLVDHCRSGAAALRRLRTRRYDVVLVDWVLDDFDGVELGQRIRASPPTQTCALIMLTGRRTDREHECVALDAGFDDFVTKPCDTDVLCARIMAVVRVKSNVFPTGFADDALEVHVGEPVAKVCGRMIDVPPREWRFLCALYGRRGRAVERAALAEAVWGANPPADAANALDQVAGRLRARLSAAKGSRSDGPNCAGLLETVRGYGFRLRFWSCKTME